MSHTIIVTKVPDAENDDHEYTIGGDHVGARCDSLKVCRKDWHRHPGAGSQAWDEGEWSTKRAGEHIKFDGEWMVPDTRNCGVIWAMENEGSPDGLTDITEPGEYPVEVEWEDDWYWVVVPLKVAQS